MFRASRLAPILLLLAAVPVAGEAAEESAAPLPEVPVVFRHDTLFHVRAQVGRLGPEERARDVEERLAAIAGSDPVAVRIEERAGASDLYAGEAFVLSVTEIDAFGTGRTRQQVAADYALNLKEALDREYKGRSVRGIFFAVVLTVIATALLLVFLRAVRSLVERIGGRIRAWSGTRIRTLHIHGVEVVSADRTTEALVGLLRFVRLLVVVAAVASYVNAVLGFFPWTRGAARAIFGFAWRAAANVFSDFVGFLPNLAYLAIIVAVARLLLKAARIVASQVETGAITIPGVHREWADPTYKIARFVAVAFALVISFPYLPGSASPAFAGISIFVGVLLALGSTSAVANAVAGIVLTYVRPFAVGDRVEIAGSSGEVVARNLLVVRLRTPDNAEVTLANSLVLGRPIVNLSAAARFGGLELALTVHLDAGAPWARVHDVLAGAAVAVEGVLPAPAPVILQRAVDERLVAYELRVRTDRPESLEAVDARLHQAVADALRKAGFPPEPAPRRAAGGG